MIGAGIVGLSAAYSLLADGHGVTVLDRDPAGDKASFGNAGGIGISEIVPASAPGLLWRVPGWLLDPLGPLSLRIGHLPALMPWLWRFLRSGTPAEILRATTALAALTRDTYDDLVPMLAALGLAGDLHRVGALSVYETSDGFRRDCAEWDAKRGFGVVAEEISGDEAREREPALGPVVKRAIATPGWAHVSDPKTIVDRLRGWLAGRGVRIERGEAAGFERGAVHVADGRRLTFDVLVVAAGAWSGRLARLLGRQGAHRKRTRLQLDAARSACEAPRRGHLCRAEVRGDTARDRAQDRRRRGIRGPRCATELSPQQSARGARGPLLAGTRPGRRRRLDGAPPDHPGQPARDRSVAEAPKRPLRVRPRAHRADRRPDDRQADR